MTNFNDLNLNACIYLYCPCKCSALACIGCRTNGPSDKWAVGLLGGPLFHDYAEITTTERVGI